MSTHPDAMKAAAEIYETHKVESMTMPCFGLPTETYIAELAAIINRHCRLAEKDAAILPLIATLVKCEAILRKWGDGAEFASQLPTKASVDFGNAAYNARQELALYRERRDHPIRQALQGGG